MHHRRRREKQIEIVKQIAAGGLSSLISAELEKAILPLRAGQIAIHLNIPQSDVEKTARENPQSIQAYPDKNDLILLAAAQDSAIKAEIKDTLYKFHQANPLLAEGKSFNELLGIFGKTKSDIHHPALQLILQDLQQQGKIRQENKTWVLAAHQVVIDDQLKAQVAQVEAYIKNSDKLFASTSDLFAELDMPQKRLSMILTHLRNSQVLGVINGNFIHQEIIAKAKQSLFDLAAQSPDGIKLAEFRDIMRTNRNSALELLEYFDNQKLTVRVGNIRKIRK
ncbi:MAG: SelB C-terminal domain-containing protein [Candidatus Cloacimonadales bacterium]